MPPSTRLDLPVRAAPLYDGLAVGTLVVLALLLAGAAVAALLVDPPAPGAAIVALFLGAALPAAVLCWYLRRAAWLDGSVLTRRSLAGTRSVDLTGAHVRLQTYRNRQLVLWARRPGSDTSVGVPLRYDYGRTAGPFIAPPLLLALADAIGPPADADTETVVATLRRFATDPTIRTHT